MPGSTPMRNAIERGSMMPVIGDAGEKSRIWFRFVPRGGWFPQDTEGLWGTKLGNDTARVQNAPFPPGRSG